MPANETDPTFKTKHSTIEDALIEWRLQEVEMDLSSSMYGPPSKEQFAHLRGLVVKVQEAFAARLAAIDAAPVKRR